MLNALDLILYVGPSHTVNVINAITFVLIYCQCSNLFLRTDNCIHLMFHDNLKAITL